MVPFAGWEMPVQYTGIFEEHLATRNAAGLFDVSHMGVYDVRGADAASFLDSVCGNDCGSLQPGESLYSHFLTPDADVLDDTLVYRRGWDNYLVVVNASNDDKVRDVAGECARWHGADRQRAAVGADVWIQRRDPQLTGPEGWLRYESGHRPAGTEEPRYAGGNGHG